MIAIGFPLVVWGFFLICDSAIQPSITPTIAGTGPKQPIIRPERPAIIDAIANVWLCWRGRGGGGGCQPGDIGDIGGRSSGATHAGGIGGSRGSHCVSCSEAVVTFGSRILGSQFGSTGGDNSSIRSEPSSEQKVSQTSLYCRLHCGQYFIGGSDQFQATEEVTDFDCGVFV